LVSDVDHQIVTGLPPPGSDADPLSSRGVPPLVKACLALAGLLVLAIVAHEVGALRGSWTGLWIDDVGFTSVAALAAVSVLACARRRSAARRAWLALGIALVMTAIANGLWVAVWANAAVSPADALFLLAYAVIFVALVLLARSWAQRPPVSLWVDGIAGALAVASVGAAILLPSIVDAGHAPILETIVQAAYPIGDVTTIAFVAVLFGLVGGRPQPVLVAIILGLVAQSIADGSYVWSLTGGHAELVARISEVLWSVGWLTLGIAPWLRDRQARELRITGWNVMTLPVGTAATAAIVLAAGCFHRLPALAVGLALATLIAGSVRALLTFLDLRGLSEARHEARTDELTGLANRRQFIGQLEQVTEGNEYGTAALLLIDLDRFKELNDALGHSAGDILLAKLGPRLAALMRREDTIARLGGDEFGLLCPEADARAAYEIADRVKQAFAAPFQLEDLLVTVDVSIGVALYPDHATTAGGLLQRADVAMYQAKAAQSRIELYDSARDVHTRQRLRLVADLRHALEHGEGLELHFQPQVGLADGVVDGVEALIRWRHPERGLLPPNEFLEAAVGAGLMRRVTSFVLRSAVHQLAEWAGHGRLLPIAINLSATDLVDRTLADEVRALLAEHMVDSRLLRLELTESDVMIRPEQSLETLRDLREVGCPIAIDDFGTGHSSLSLLKMLPFDELKLDRTFVAGLGNHAVNTAIVRAATALGRELSLRVVAEGIEDEAEMRRLVELGATSAQGYLISRPITIDALEQWLEVRAATDTGSSASGAPAAA
jgi:diguanylate cyclase (GGDEF)-like protein